MIEDFYLGLRNLCPWIKYIFLSYNNPQFIYPLRQVQIYLNDKIIYMTEQVLTHFLRYIIIYFKFDLHIKEIFTETSQVSISVTINTPVCRCTGVFLQLILFCVYDIMIYPTKQSSFFFSLKFRKFIEPTKLFVMTFMIVCNSQFILCVILCGFKIHFSDETENYT